MRINVTTELIITPNNIILQRWQYSIDKLISDQESYAKYAFIRKYYIEFIFFI